MKLFNYKVGTEVRIGAISDGKCCDITGVWPSVGIGGIIGGGEAALDAIRAAVKSGALPELDEGILAFANVTQPQKIVCEGLNYKSHAEETGGTAPEHPVFFSKFNDALTHAGAEVELPEWQRCYDYEAELVIVIGRTAYNVSEDEAMSYVFGYTCGNDLSARDCQFLSSQWLSGKSFPGFAPAGPYIVPRDDFDPCGDNRIYCKVNGETVQDGLTSDMIFTCAQTVSYASRYFRLEPGDLVFTGTPAGVILGKEKGTRVWLKAGDVVTVGIDGIGELITPLV